MYDLIAVGDVKMDTFITLSDAQVRVFADGKEEFLGVPYGKKTPVPEVFSQPAGSAPNVAIAMRRFRRSSAVMSIMGNDPTHDNAISFLQGYGVDVRYISSKKGASSFSAVINHRGESTQLVSHSSFTHRLPLFMPRTKWMHLSEVGHGYERLYRDVLKRIRGGAFKLSLNPGSVQLAAPRDVLFDVLQITDVLFLNMSEAFTLLKLKPKEKNIRGVLRELHALGPKIVVVTDGKKGATAFDGVAILYAPMFPGKRVEATGAGDAFCSGFLGALLAGHSTAEALRWGSVNAASAVGQIGPTAGLLTKSEILKRLKAHRTYRVKPV